MVSPPTDRGGAASRLAALRGDPAGRPPPPPRLSRARLRSAAQIRGRGGPRRALVRSHGMASVGVDRVSTRIACHGDGRDGTQMHVCHPLRSLQILAQDPGARSRRSGGPPHSIASIAEIALFFMQTPPTVFHRLDHIRLLFATSRHQSAREETGEHNKSFKMVVFDAQAYRQDGPRGWKQKKKKHARS